MKIIFFGLGSIGRRHLRLLQETGKYEIYALRTRLGELVDDDAGARILGSWSEVDQVRPEVSFITNPTSLHVPTAIECARRGMALFIEKPLSAGMKGVAELSGICRRKKLSCYVAYPLRFHPVILKAKELLAKTKPLHAQAVCASYLPDWRPGRKVKEVYSAKRQEGGGVILDLSHEFDYLSYLLGLVRNISGVQGRVSNVTVDSEDFADAELLFGSGVHAHVHLNYFSRKIERWFHVDCADGFVRGDLVVNTLVVSHRGKENTFCFSVERDDYFRAQLDYFFAHLRQGRMMNGLDDAVPLLKKILEFRHG